MEPTLSSRFWAEKPWPSEFSFRRVEVHVIPTRGRSGRWVLEEIEVEALGRRQRGVLVSAPRLVPAGVHAVAQRLDLALKDSLRNRLGPPGELLRVVVVEVASPGLITACDREGLGLIDLTGALHLTSATFFTRVQGTRKVKRVPRVSAFTPVGERVVRVLLNQLDEAPPVRELAKSVHASYASVWGTLQRLEELGLIRLRRGRGPQVLEPSALVEHWCAGGRAPVREGFHCPTTSVEALRRGVEALHAGGATALLTYRSALSDDEVVVSGLPHGLRTAASTELVVKALGLRPSTPTNFFILREPADQDHEHGGPRMASRTLPAGPAVSVPQLIFDLHFAGDRAAEQAEATRARWARALPPRSLDD